MALSYRQYAADGVTRDFAVPFQYIDRRHVSVLVDGTSVPFTWLSNFTVRAAGVPARSSVVTVRRDTPKDQVLVDYVDGSTLTESDLDLGTVQNFFLAQEAYDIAEGTLSVNDDGSFSAGARRISDLADPTLPHQATTKNYVDTAMTSQVQQANAARASSEAAQRGAQSAEAQATQQRVLAENAQLNAQAARDSASGHRLNAQNAEARALAAAVRSEVGADRSEAALDALSDEVERAEGAATRASDSAAAAATFDPALYARLAGATFSGSVSTGGRFQSESGVDWGANIQPGVTDWNAVTRGGVYMKSAMANAPGGTTGWFYVIVQRHNATHVSQTAVSLGGASVFQRVMANGTWSAWAEVWTSTNAPDATDAEADAGSSTVRRMWPPARLHRAARAAKPSRAMHDQGGDEESGLSNSQTVRLISSFVAVAPLALAQASCSLRTITSNEAVHGFAAVGIWGVTEGAYMALSTEQVLSFPAAPAGEHRTVSRSIAAANLVPGRTYHTRLLLRSTLINRLAPSGMVISGLNT